jgi:hypothetical protein
MPRRAVNAGFSYNRSLRGELVNGVQNATGLRYACRRVNPWGTIGATLAVMRQATNPV